MAKSREKLAASLKVVRDIQEQKNSVAIKSVEISRTHRERLVKMGFLQHVTKGWYAITNPENREGDTTSWYSTYWQFCARFLQEKYQTYCIAAEQSILLHAGHTVIPQQLIILSPNAPNDTINLIHDTSLYILKSKAKNIIDTVDFHGLKIMPLEMALVKSSPILFEQNPIELQTILAMIGDASALLKILLAGSHSVVAGRIAGAFREVGKDKIADNIVKTMKAADFVIKETNPFNKIPSSILSLKERSPYANRIRLLWAEMRKVILTEFPKSPGLSKSKEKYLTTIDEIYITDAYHSLSIERYVVTTELIKKVKSGLWSLNSEDDKKRKDAMAARGYWQASQAVKVSIKDILDGKNPGETIDHNHGDWYRALFAPSVKAGILNPADLAGYRTGQVYISNSKHTPPNKDALREVMPVFFDLLSKEPEPGVRVVLGHFFFVYIHPYMDGNGRMARFLMNTMLASGGYPWTVIPVEKRTEYMNTLEEASVENNILPFTKFIAQLVKKSISGKPEAKVK